MARFSNMAYTKKANSAPDVKGIKTELGGIDPKFTDVSGFDAKSSQGAIIKHEEYVVAVFRGTDEIADLARQPECRRHTRTTRGRSHGFPPRADGYLASNVNDHPRLPPDFRRPAGQTLVAHGAQSRRRHGDFGPGDSD